MFVSNKRLQNKSASVSQTIESDHRICLISSKLHSSADREDPTEGPKTTGKCHPKSLCDGQDCSQSHLSSDNEGVRQPSSTKLRRILYTPKSWKCSQVEPSYSPPDESCDTLPTSHPKTHAQNIKTELRLATQLMKPELNPSSISIAALTVEPRVTKSILGVKPSVADPKCFISDKFIKFGEADRGERNITTLVSCIPQGDRGSVSHSSEESVLQSSSNTLTLKQMKEEIASEKCVSSPVSEIECHLEISESSVPLISGIQNADEYFDEDENTVTKEKEKEGLLGLKQTSVDHKLEKEMHP